MVNSGFELYFREAVVSKFNKRILGPINLGFEASGLTTIVGPNGSGKSTLLSAKANSNGAGHMHQSQSKHLFSRHPSYFGAPFLRTSCILCY